MLLHKAKGANGGDLYISACAVALKDVSDCPDKMKEAPRT